LLLAYPSAVASHRAAGAAWVLDAIEPGTTELLIPPALDLRRPLVHRTEDLLPFEIVERKGLRVTDPTRTLCDLGAVVDLDTLERATESALRRGLTSIPRLTWRSTSLARQGKAGPPALRAVLARRPGGAAPTESDLETRYLQCLRAHGVPQPIRQFPVDLPDGTRVRLDGAWPDAMVFVELDGWDKHRSRPAFVHDRRRQNRVVVALGWRPLRYVWEDVVGDPAATAAETYAALASRSDGRSWSEISRSNRSAEPATQLRQSG
jgi:hypothetical protein